jgi:hypothetical protein
LASHVPCLSAKTSFSHSVLANVLDAVGVGSSGSLQGGRNQDKQAQLIKAVFYGAQVFYSFFIM